MIEWQSNNSYIVNNFATGYINWMSFWKILWKCVQSCRRLKYVHKPRINQRVLKENESKSERKWKVETRNRRDQKNQRPSGYDISRFLRVRKSTKKIESPRSNSKKFIREICIFTRKRSFKNTFNYKKMINIYYIQFGLLLHLT